MRTLSACAIFKDEAAYLYEWLAFHSLVGVEHFYLYDNGSGDAFRPEIDAALPRGNYTLIDWPVRPGQYPAYDDCLQRARGETQWLAVIDIDEFLFSPEHADLRHVLTDYEAHPALVSNWLYFGSSGHQETPPGFVTRAYTRRCNSTFRVGLPGMMIDRAGNPRDLMNYYPQCGHYKSILQPHRTERCFNAHAFVFRDGARAVTEAFMPVTTRWTPEVTVGRIRINHYWSRSIADLRRKAARGRVADGGTDDLAVMLRMEREMNAIEDLAIQPLAAHIPPRATI